MPQVVVVGGRGCRARGLLVWRGEGRGRRGRRKVFGRHWV
jgi:hypothetical protein